MDSRIELEVEQNNVKFRPALLFAVTLSAVLSAFVPAKAQPSANGKTFTVSTLFDNRDTSMRAAILYANAHPGTTIVFSENVLNLHLSSQLPAITGHKTVIDGGAIRRDILIASPTETTPDSAFVVQAADCIVRGFALNGFKSAIHITGAAAQRNRIERCIFGIRRNNSAESTDFNRCNIRIDNGAMNNIIGGDAATTGNIISKPAPPH